jgi:hypothetical protein
MQVSGETAHLGDVMSGERFRGIMWLHAGEHE